jgi:hypothetical protein
MTVNSSYTATAPEYACFNVAMAAASSSRSPSPGSCWTKTVSENSDTLTLSAETSHNEPVMRSVTLADVAGALAYGAMRLMPGAGGVAASALVAGDLVAACAAGSSSHGTLSAAPNGQLNVVDSRFT